MLSGDLFDREWRDFNTGLFFLHELNRLRASGTEVLIVRGNHDAKNAVTRGLRYPEHVFEFSAERPETKVVQGVAFHGQSFAESIVDRDLSLAYPEAHPDLVNIGLLHTSLDGREGHDPYAPTRVSVLRERGYDYWALGHVHAREIVSDAPWMVYPGNLQGRNIRETGAKGAMHFRAEKGAVQELSFAALDVLRFEHLRLAIAPGQSFDDSLDHARELLRAARAADTQRILALRLSVTGTERALAPLLRNQERFTQEVRALALRFEQSWVEKVTFEPIANTEPAPSAFVAFLRTPEAQARSVNAAVSASAELPEALRESVLEDALAHEALAELRAELAAEDPP